MKTAVAMLTRFDENSGAAGSTQLDWSVECRTLLQYHPRKLLYQDEEGWHGLLDVTCLMTSSCEDVIISGEKPCLAAQVPCARNWWAASRAYCRALY